jgi:anti-anti-sigma regulatory factor
LPYIRREVEVSAVIRISQIGNGSRRHLLVEGKLSDGWVDALESSWLEAQLQGNGTPVCIDLAGVTYIDDKGRDLLVRIIRSGAELRAQGIMTRAVVEEITKDLNRNERTERRGGTVQM